MISDDMMIWLIIGAGACGAVAFFFVLGIPQYLRDRRESRAMYDRARRMYQRHKEEAEKAAAAKRADHEFAGSKQWGEPAEIEAITCFRTLHGDVVYTKDGARALIRLREKYPTMSREYALWMAHNRLDIIDVLQGDEPCDPPSSATPATSQP